MGRKVILVAQGRILFPLLVATTGATLLVEHGCVQSQYAILELIEGADARHVV